MAVATYAREPSQDDPDRYYKGGTGNLEFESAVALQMAAEVAG